MSTAKESPLWDPLPGMIVCFPRPYSGQTEYAHVLGVQVETATGSSRGNTTVTRTVVAYLPAIFPVSTDEGPEIPPQWGRRPQYVTLTYWRKIVPRMAQLPFDWEPTQLEQPGRVVRLSAQAYSALCGCLARLETHRTEEERVFLEKFLPTKQYNQ